MDRVPDARPGAARSRGATTCDVYVVDEHLCAGAAGRPRPDRLLRASASAAATSTTPSAPGESYLTDPHRRGRAALPRRRLRPLAAGRQAGVPRPPRHPGQDPWLPDRDRRDRERPAAGARRPRRRRGGRRAAGPQQAPGGLLLRPAADRRRGPAGAAGRVAARVHGPVGLPLAGEPAAHRQRQDRPQGADRARRTSWRRRGGRTTRRARRPSSGWRPPGPRCSASRRTRSAGATTSSTGVARRCRR